ncbi:CDP-alcohol phosphatidyltransferase family protein [Candidatus Bathyarchaeota archaeon]|nr:MAG: CDP-alcohol phosphatidyltransferase family protein [Candidatus Bathyarchaeota archaeon]
MVSGKLKERFNQWIKAEARFLHRLGLSPNDVTVLGLLLSLCSALLYLNWRRSPLMLPVAGVLLLSSGFFDALDGAIARMFGEVTTFGGFLDSLLDRYSDAAVLAAITLGGLCDPFWGLSALIGSLLVSYSRARAEAGGVRMASIGFAERAERMVFIAFLSLVSPLWMGALWWGMILLALMVHVTVIQRAHYFYKSTRG